MGIRPLPEQWENYRRDLSQSRRGPRLTLAKRYCPKGCPGGAPGGQSGDSAPPPPMERYLFPLGHLRGCGHPRPGPGGHGRRQDASSPAVQDAAPIEVTAPFPNSGNSKDAFAGGALERG